MHLINTQQNPTGVLIIPTLQMERLSLALGGGGALTAKLACLPSQSSSFLTPLLGSTSFLPTRPVTDQEARLGGDRTMTPGPRTGASGAGALCPGRLSGSGCHRRDLRTPHPRRPGHLGHLHNQQ